MYLAVVTGERCLKYWISRTSRPASAQRKPNQPAPQALAGDFVESFTPSKEQERPNTAAGAP